MVPSYTQSQTLAYYTVRILANPFYAGYFTWQGESYTHNAPVAISKQDFDEVQKILGKRAHKKSPNRFAYSGLILCSSCGYRVTAEVSKGHTYYHCNNRLGTCTKKGIREEELEHQIDKLLKKITLPPGFEEMAIEVLQELRKDELASHRHVFEAQQSMVADIKRQKDALLGLYLQGHLTGEEFATKKKELSEREISVKLEESQADLNFEKTYETIVNVATFAVRARSLFKTGDSATKRMIAAQLGAQYMLLNGKEVSIELNSLFVPVRPLFKKLEKDFQKVEPQKTRSQSWKERVSASQYEVWQTTLVKYRKYVRVRNAACIIPLFPQHEEERMVA